MADNARTAICGMPTSADAPQSEINFTGFIVDVLGADGAWRPIEDRAGEPEIFPTASSALDVAEGWCVSFNAQTRVRDLVTGHPVPSEIDDMIEALDAVDPRPAVSDYEAWIAEGIEAAAEVRAFERSRAAIMRWLYAVEDAA